VIEFIGAGKKGKELRDQFKAAPFGWEQDVIDGALLVMLVAGNLRATNNGQPVQPSLPQNQIGVASFYLDVPPLDVKHRLELKALFQKAGITTQNGKESEAAAEFVRRLLALAALAGGPAPQPEIPDTFAVRALQQISGNAQLHEIHLQKDDLSAKLASWKKYADGIAKRWPAWERLLTFQTFATGLPEAASCSTSITAIITGRTLLAEPDPVPELTKQLTAALRVAVGTLQDNLAAAFKTGDAKLAASHVWNELSDDQRMTLINDHQLTPPPKAAIGSDDEILVALRARSVTDRHNLLDAMPQRYARALEEAGRLANPAAVRIMLSSAIVNNLAELEQWLDRVRQQVEAQLKNGPVIL